MDLQLPSISPIALSYGECISCTFRLKFNSLRIIVIYRPPKSDFSNFFDELYDLINNILHQNASKVMIIGDFNYQFDCSSPQHSLFKQLPDSLGLNQHVYFPMLVLTLLISFSLQATHQHLFLHFHALIF